MSSFLYALKMEFSYKDRIGISLYKMKLFITRPIIIISLKEKINKMSEGR